MFGITCLSTDTSLGTHVPISPLGSRYGEGSPYPYDLVTCMVEIRQHWNPAGDLAVPARYHTHREVRGLPRRNHDMGPPSRPGPIKRTKTPRHSPFEPSSHLPDHFPHQPRAAAGVELRGDPGYVIRVPISKPRVAGSVRKWCWVMGNRGWRLPWRPSVVRSCRSGKGHSNAGLLL